MTAVRQREEAHPEATPGGVVRYSLYERILHWFVALTFIYLLLTGFALGYPRMAWLFDVLGGGQSVRFLHPIVGVAFTIGTVLMLVSWLPQNRFGREDREWLRRLRTYMREGHSGLDLGKYNAGQKGFFWLAVVAGVVLFLTGLPLWFPGLLETAGTVNRVMRLVHHVAFLFMVAGFIVHVYLSTVMFPGTMSAMTTGRVSRAWAAWHHPRWFREQEATARSADGTRET